ncbi:MAG: protein-glutamate O-methyltransferase CheR [Proteobacteria bacterium]|nr:protein-glutamate O-methyltransferase CheR [Pseudomonadota bacterium]
MTQARPFHPAASLIERRIGLALRAHNVTLVEDPANPAIDEIFAAAPIDGESWQSVIEAITIGETRFHRDRNWFSQIENRVLRPLIARRRADGDRRIAIWCAGCSSGEEPYSLAMLLRDLIADIGEWNIRIDATDIRVGALDAARRGLYHERQLRELAATMVARHFVAAGPATYSVDDGAKRLVAFDFFNLADPATYPVTARRGGYDLVVCRNVLMYFGAEIQSRIARHLVMALAPQGWLAVAPAEATAALFAPLVPVNTEDAIFFRDAGQDRRRVADTASREAFAAVVPPPTFVAKPPPAPSPISAPVPVSDMQGEPNEAADRGDHARARELCLAQLARDPVDARTNLVLAQICLEMGDFVGARAAARRAIYLVPGCATAHFLMATAWRHDGDGERARRAMRVALKLVQTEETDELEGALPAGYIRRAAVAYLNGEMRDKSDG